MILARFRTSNVALPTRVTLCALACVLAGAPVAWASNGGTEGWQAQRYSGIRAARSVRLSHETAHTGRGSLAIDLGLNGKVESLRQGEVFVDLRYYPPDNVEAPVNLQGRAVTAWVFAPAGLQGPAPNPNGFRLFVKDRHWHSEYGPWTHVRPGHWNRLTLVPSTSTPITGYKDAGFEPQQIVMLGVSVATGRGSAARYVGPMFLDDVTWGSASRPRYGFENR